MQLFCSLSPSPNSLSLYLSAFLSLHFPISPFPHLFISLSLHFSFSIFCLHLFGSHLSITPLSSPSNSRSSFSGLSERPAEFSLLFTCPPFETDVVTKAQVSFQVTERSGGGGASQTLRGLHGGLPAHLDTASLPGDGAFTGESR